MQHLDHARPVVGQRRVDRLALAPGDKLAALRFGQRAGDEVAVLQPRQRPHAVPAQLGPQALEEGELHVGPGLDFFFDQVEVALIAGAVEDDLACGVTRPDNAVVQVQRAVGAHQREHVGTKTAEAVIQRRVLRMQLFGNRHGVLRPADHLRHVALQQRTVLEADMLVNAARHRTGAVHPLARRGANHLLAEFAQQHALPGDVGVRLRHADDVAPVHFGVEAEQQVGG